VVLDATNNSIGETVEQVVTFVRNSPALGTVQAPGLSDAPEEES